MMGTTLQIDRALNTPIYQQIVNSVLMRIEDGSLLLGAQVPSINQVAGEYKLARETVVKAFKILQEQGIISPVHGKGFFVSSVEFSVKNRIFLFFDTFSAYKEVIYNALRDGVGAGAFIDIYYYHFNFRVFKKLIRESAGNYHSYIIIPMDHEKLDQALSVIPDNQLFLLDIKPRFSNKTYSGIFQDFEEDVFRSLSSAVNLCRKYSKLVLVFRNQLTDPPDGIVSGFNRFCNDFQFDSMVIRTSLSKRKLQKGEAYIVIDDEDLVYLVEHAHKSGLQLGTDLGIISYNEIPLKKNSGEWDFRDFNRFCKNGETDGTNGNKTRKMHRTQHLPFY